MKMKSKKGALLHWVVFGILAAIGLFTFLTLNVKVDSGVKGAWHLQFLEENYLPAQEKLLELDIQAKEVGTEVLKELAVKGGFEEQSGCGSVGYNVSDKLVNFNLWNNAEKECFPDFTQEGSNLFLKRFKQEITNKSISKVLFKDQYLIGFGNTGVINSKIGSYKYQNNFKVELPYSIQEYNDLISKARRLVMLCQDQKNLKSCLNQYKLEQYNDWNYSSCDEEKYLEKERKVAFCIVGENGLRYNFGLDFSSAQAFKVDSLQVKYDDINDLYLISFEQDLHADEYSLYYTDFKVGDKKGSVEDVFYGFSEQFNFLESINLENLLEVNCPLQKEAGSSYLCYEDGVFRQEYVLKDALINPRDEANGKEVYITATSWKNGVESEVNNFVLLE